MGTVPAVKSACCVWGTSGRSAATASVSGPTTRGHFQFLELVRQELKVPPPPTQDVYTRGTIPQLFLVPLLMSTLTSGRRWRGGFKAVETLGPVWPRCCCPDKRGA